jgi:hypothetical protein
MTGTGGGIARRVEGIGEDTMDRTGSTIAVGLAGFLIARICGI